MNIVNDDLEFANNKKRVKLSTEWMDCSIFRLIRDCHRFYRTTSSFITARDGTNDSGLHLRTHRSRNVEGPVFGSHGRLQSIVRFIGRSKPQGIHQAWPPCKPVVHETGYDAIRG
jgi:hypothetical protein